MDFHPTKRLGDISIDADRRLIRIRHASKGVKTRHPWLAVCTFGVSTLVRWAVRPTLTIPFDAIAGVELLENGGQVSNGGVGSAVAGGVLFGGVGAVAGAMMGGRRTTGMTDTLALQVRTHDPDWPIVVVTYLNKAAKTSSNRYRRAWARAQETLALVQAATNASAQRRADATLR